MARFTVDDLFGVPATGLATAVAARRAEVLDGRLLVAPPPTRRHERVLHHLTARFRLLLPGGVVVRHRDPVRLPDGDGPVPDLLVATAREHRHGWPAREVHTVVEVVSPDGRFIDRVWKRERYADAGVPCYWRVDLVAWPGMIGPPPVVAVRVRQRSGWQEIVAGPGRLHTLPLGYGREPGGAAACVPVRLDPASLLVRQAAGW